MKHMKVLAIGNSFSQDAVEYLRKIALSGDFDILVGNLYIGGCSLEQHWNNAVHDTHDYCYSRFGEECTVQENAAILETLKSESWDYITFQQASHYSGMPETYHPYLKQLSDYVKQQVPNAEQIIHQTWAYEIDSDHEGFANYQRNQKTMYHALMGAYNQAANLIGARIIPSGQAVQMVRATAPFHYQNGGKSLCRDGFHISIPHGRYLLGLVWYQFLTGKANSTFVPSENGITISKEEEEIFRDCAHKAIMMHR